MQENSGNFIYLKGIVIELKDDIARAKAILEDSRVITFHYTTFKSNPPTRFPKLNEKIIVTYQDNLLFGFISVRSDCDK